MSCDQPIPIRNLTTLKADMVQELRQTLDLLEIWKQADVIMNVRAAGDIRERVDRKIRNVLEYLTGDRQ